MEIFKKFHQNILIYWIVLFIPLFLGAYSNEFDISKGNFADKLPELSAIIAGLLTFEIVFYMFRWEVLTGNKRSCGLRERLFRERIEDVLGKDYIPKKGLDEERWKQIKKEFIGKTSKEEYEEIFEKAYRKELNTLQEKYAKILDEGKENWKWLTYSLIPSLSAIFFSFLSIILKGLNLKIPSFAVNSILMFILISFGIFVITIFYYIPFVLENWITKDE